MNLKQLVSSLIPFRRHRLSLENPGVPITGNTLSLFHSGTHLTQSGYYLSDLGILTYSPMWSGIWMISDDVAQLPFVTYRRTSDTDREKATDHRVFNVLRRHTGTMNANEWISTTIVNGLLYGNSVSRVLDSGSSRIGLQFYERNNWSIERRQGNNIYRLTEEDDTQDLAIEEEVIHIKGMMIDGYQGLSLADYCRNSIARALSTEKYGDDFFRNGTLPQGFFVHPGQPSDEAVNRLVKLMEARMQTRRPFGVLREGLTFEKTGVNPVDAMYVDAMAFGIDDAARWLKIPKHKLGDDTKTSYNSVEQENRAYLHSTLMPWIVRLEFEINNKLFGPIEQGRYFAEFNTNAFLRPVLADRMDAYAKAVQWGIMTRNEARQSENLPSLPGLDEPLTPLNMHAGADPSEAQEAQAAEQDAFAEPQAERQDVKLLVRDQLHHEMTKQAKRVMFTAAQKSRNRGATRENVQALVDDICGKFANEFKVTGKLVSHYNGNKPEIAVNRIAAAVRESAQRRISSALDGEMADAADRITNVVTDVISDCGEFASDFVME